MSNLLSERTSGVYQVIFKIHYGQHDSIKMIVKPGEVCNPASLLDAFLTALLSKYRVLIKKFYQKTMMIMMMNMA